MTGYRPGALAAHWLDAQSVQVARPPTGGGRGLCRGELQGPGQNVAASTALCRQPLGSRGLRLPRGFRPGCTFRTDPRLRRRASHSGCCEEPPRAADHTGPTHGSDLACWCRPLAAHPPARLARPTAARHRHRSRPCGGDRESLRGDLTDVLLALIRDGNAPDRRSAPQIYGEAPLAWLGESG